MDQHTDEYGTTSAYAEKSISGRKVPRDNWNYLRIRGEEWLEIYWRTR